MERRGRKFDILLVEDNPADAELTEMILRHSTQCARCNHVIDGVEAMAYLRQEAGFTQASRPDLVLLDLNMPRKSGREVLQEIKADERLKTIPVVILTTSDDEGDVLSSYRLHANCYISKPVDLEKFTRVLQSLGEFWFNVAKLPPHDK